MENTKLILIISLVFVSSSFGIYKIIKKIHQCVPDPTNVLTRRRGNIELIDFNEPTEPLQAYIPNRINDLEIGIQTSNIYPVEVGIQTSDNFSYPLEVAIQTSNSSSSANIQPIPSYFRDFINCPLENENTFNLLNYLIDNKYLTLSIISLTVITGFWIKSYFFTTPSSPPNSPPTFNLSLDQLKEIEVEAEDKISHFNLEQLSEIVDKLNRGEELEEDIRDKLNQDFKILVNDIQNSSGHHPLADQPVYINSCLEFENSYFIITIILIFLFIIIFYYKIICDN